MNADQLGDALSWVGDTALIDALDGEFAAEVEAACPPEAVDGLGPEALRRVLRAPEVTRRLLFPDSAPAGTGASVARAAAVERALDGTGPPVAEPSWSALGDVLVRPDGSAAWWPRLAGPAAIPLDFGSPWAQHVDLTGREEFARRPHPDFTPHDVGAIHDRLAAAMAAIETMSPCLSGFVARATCVLVLQADPDAPGQIASGTNGHYVGRSFLTNPHLPEATVECLAEGVVHEAIHGLIYRDSLRHPWVHGEAAEEVARVESPWTGRPLPVRAFLEASCVWFGLVHLWVLAARTSTMDADIARDRLVTSVRGFGFGPLVDRVQPWWSEVRPDVLDTVDGLQARLLDALVGAP